MLSLIFAAALAAAEPYPAYLNNPWVPYAPAASAEPAGQAPQIPGRSTQEVVLVCSGSVVVEHTNTDLTQPAYAWGSSYTGTGFDHQVVIDFAARTVQLNGRSMVVSRLDDEQVVFSTVKRGVVGFALSQAFDIPTYIIERRTGAYRFRGGSGACQRREPTQRLF